MKTLILLFSLIPICSLGQIETIESISIDSLIFEKINTYRMSKNVDPFEAFEDSLMREFSYDLTRANSKKEIIEHSEDFLDYANAECIYSKRMSHYSDKTIDAIDNEDFEILAEDAVEGWINSPSHEHCISHPFYHIATITTRIVIDREKKTLYFVASFHALSSVFDTRTGYTYNF